MSRISIDRLHLQLLLIATVAAGCGQPPPDNSALAQTVLKKFAGDWAVVAYERAGQKTPPTSLKDVMVIIENDKFTLMEIKGASGKSTGPTSSRLVTSEFYTMQVDPAKSKDEINFAYSSGDSAGKVRPGIFECEANTIKICLGEVGGARPGSFESTDKATLLVLERKQ